MKNDLRVRGGGLSDARGRRGAARAARAGRQNKNITD